MLTFAGAVAQFAALVEVDGALQGVMGLSFVQGVEPTLVSPAAKFVR